MLGKVQARIEPGLDRSWARGKAMLGKVQVRIEPGLDRSWARFGYE